MLTFIARKTYQSLVPLGAREKLWNLRHQVREQRTQVYGRLKLRYDVWCVRHKLRCNVCQGRRLAEFTNRRVAQLPFSFFVCQDCAFIFVHPPPDPVTYYAELTMPDFGEGEVVWNTHYLEAIEKYSERKGKLLEIGFGNASFLQLAEKNGWEAHGADISVPLVQYAQRELQLANIRYGTIEEIDYPSSYFDVVAAFNFLEHVPDPRGTLRSIRRILRPGGLAVLMCPNIAGIYHLLVPDIFFDGDALNITWIPPDHIGYFNKDNLKLLMESVGLAVIGDESHRMSSLWRQHEVNIGPQMTDRKLADLLAEIDASAAPKGSARVAEYRDEIRKLLLERMSWVMVSDMMRLEPALGAENAILFVGRKDGAQA